MSNEGHLAPHGQHEDIYGISAAKMFYAPKIYGYRLDWCRVWASQRGKPAADEFCKRGPDDLGTGKLCSSPWPHIPI